jgi:hypothetical protein
MPGYEQLCKSRDQLFSSEMTDEKLSGFRDPDNSFKSSLIQQGE